MTDRHLLIVVVLIAVAAVAVAWHYREEGFALKSAAIRNSEPAAIPTIQHELALGPHERMRLIALPSAMMPSQSDTCLLYTNDESHAALLQCRSWIGEWGHPRE